MKVVINPVHNLFRLLTSVQLMTLLSKKISESSFIEIFCDEFSGQK